MKKKILIIGSIIVVIIIILLNVSYFSSDKKLANNKIPMYGFSSYDQYLRERTSTSAKIDDDFVKGLLDHDKGDKRGLSNQACDRGFQYFNSDDASTAMKRFNQGWILDHENPCVFAGYGYVYGKTGEYDKATTYYEKAIQLSASDKSYSWIYTDYSEIMIQCYHFSKERVDCLNKAETSLNIAAKLSDNPKVHRSMAFLYYEKGDYQKAWDEVHKAINGGMSKDAFNTGFGQALREKMPDPLR